MEEVQRIFFETINKIDIIYWYTENKVVITAGKDAGERVKCVKETNCLVTK